jgi:two-component system, OmpR family, sensor kinase
VVATAFTTTETEGATTRIAGSPLGRRHLIRVWTVWALGCVAVMVALPGHESSAYHLGWVGFALAFGFGTWSRWQLVTSLTWFTIASGLAMERSWLMGDINWDETTEIPLMFLLAVLMVWSVLRRQAALAQVTSLAERDVQAHRDRARLMQLTSHELRTPLTIARGYIELLQARAVEPEELQDLSVVADELDRLSRVSDRLIRMLGMQDDTTRELVDMDRVMAQVVERWQVVTDRRWVLDAHVGHAVGSPERLRTCIDTLVENAIRYTSVGDTIRLAGYRKGQRLIVSVFDTGVGLSDDQILAINAGEPAALTETTASTDPDSDTDRLAGTGLGLSIVREAAHLRGGTLHASHAPEGGAGLTLTYPLNPPGDVGRFLPRTVSSAKPIRSGHELTRPKSQA